MRLLPYLGFGCLFLLLSHHSHGQETNILPDAPSAARRDAETITHDREVRSSVTVQPGPAPKYARYIDPGQQVYPLRAKDKLALSLAQQLEPWALTTPLLAAGWEHLLDSSPNFGSDKAGFGERLGASVLNQTSQAFLVDGVGNALFREDPRYYRVGGRDIRRRILYAASRTVLTRTDRGTRSINYAALVGYAGASALTMTYYPATSAKWDEVWKGYGISLATQPLGNALHEFGPDLLHLLHRKHP